ncbi:MAG TPA: S41 family peptidase [Anaerolineales bacterium]|nr:S41 family peptidase [Anaerolineales bacterium]
MPYRRFALVPLLVATIACSTLTRGLPLVVTPAPTLRPSRTPTPSPTSAPTLAPPAFVPPECSQVPLATIPAATVLAEPTPGAEANPPIEISEQRAVFRELKSTIEEVYLYPDFNGVDWPALVATTQSHIDAGLDTEAFYRELEGFVAALNDEHSYFESPVQVAASEAELAGTADFVGIGVLVEPLPEKGRLAILATFPGSPADRAGLQAHDSILAVDGLPVAEDGQAFPQRVRGPECSAVVLTVQSPGEPPRLVEVVRQRFVASSPVLAQLVPTTDGSRIGYIFVPTFFDESIPAQVRHALVDFGTLDGLILDNRMNGGGSSTVVEPILAFFTSGTLGHFVSRTAERPLEVAADPVHNSQDVPLVILVGEDTVSFGEIFSGALQDIGRASIVGQTTLGNVETLHGYEQRDGSRVWIAEERFQPLHTEADWETQGIVPDVEAYADWDTFTLETDPGVAAALKLLGH